MSRSASLRATHSSRRSHTPPSSAWPSAAALTVVLLGIAALSSGCGKKGPPLPPFVRLPSAPAEVAAARRGDTVVIEFRVPNVNADSTRPANVSRVDVYGLTTTTPAAEDRLLKLGTIVGSVDVKSPRDPDRIGETEDESDAEPLVGDGLDQGSQARVEERLTAAVLTPAQADTIEDSEPGGTTGPLLGPFVAGTASRAYVAVSVDTRGRTGSISPPVAVPLGPAPPAPSSPTLSYDETSVTLTWPRSSDPGAADVLPSHPLGAGSAVPGYHVYEVSAGVAVPDALEGGANASRPSETRLTGTPIEETKYVDSRIAWGETRCYAVRAVETIGGLSVESDARQPTCVAFVDTFPPAAPKGLSGVASEAGISLIWEPNTEKDFAGYLVLRGAAPGEAVDPITPAPIQETIFNDKTAPGVRYVYAIVAVDTAGNRSAPSNRFEEAAR